MSADPIRLLFPALRWDGSSFSAGSSDAGRLADDGVGGFIVFGGPAGSVRELTDTLQDRAQDGLLIGADLERGAGQQFEGARACRLPGL